MTGPMKTRHAFAFLITVAVLIHYRMHYLILIVAALVLIVLGMTVLPLPAHHDRHQRDHHRPAQRRPARSLALITFRCC